jgi:predicted Fe-Mo cluster-binding NifX family protein
MKIAFPVQEDLGLQSPVFSHFGSAPFFVVVDIHGREAEVLANQDLEHKHGSCQPLAALGAPVDAVVAGGIGGGALVKLRAAGIKVYRGMEGTVQENLEMIRAGRLPEFAPDHTCAGHGPGEPCAH